MAGGEAATEIGEEVGSLQTVPASLRGVGDNGAPLDLKGRSVFALPRSPDMEIPLKDESAF